MNSIPEEQVRFHRLGDFIEQSVETNLGMELDRVRGVSITKTLIQPRANMNNVDLKDYKILRKGEFVFNPNTARMGDKIPIALNEDTEYLVSKIYPVFRIKDHSKLDPEFLMMWFIRPDFDRYARFHSWGSARETFSWEDICAVQIPIPSIERQRHLATIYSTLRTSERRYSRMVDDLQYICDSYISQVALNHTSIGLGDFIEQSTEPNYGLSVDKVRGVSITKSLIKTKANMTNVDLSDYKLVRRGDFVFIPTTSRSGNKIAIALNAAEDCLVSKIYPVFCVTKKDELIPEFLQLWFVRSDFDRYARFHSWGSARETFSWEDMCAVRVPIPPIRIQETIVAVHAVLQSRKASLARVKNLISSAPQVFYAGILREIESA
jgi:type I restriction enzyme S subunit